MTDKPTPPFAERYHAALQLYVSGDANVRSSSHAAHLLGQEASESGMDALDLVRTHDQAMAEIYSPQKHTSLIHSHSLTPGGAFLFKSLTTLGERNAETSKITCKALRESEQRLKDEVARYNQLLIDSRCLEEQSCHLAHQLLLAQEEERREISRELHDEVAQILAGINVRLAALREGGIINFQSFEQSIQQTQQMIEESVEVVHRYAKRLRPAILDDLGLVPALRSFIKEMTRPANLQIRLEAIAEPEQLDKTRRTVIYRVAQEALLNVVRHAEANNAVVKLTDIPDGIRLEVKDDGKSFAMDQMFIAKDCKRLGLLGMKERVEMVGGVFAILSEPGQGTTVSAEIPFAVHGGSIRNHSRPFQSLRAFTQKPPSQGAFLCPIGTITIKPMAMLTPGCRKLAPLV